jgi:Putative prokaryotic signal transducing protein
MTDDIVVLETYLSEIDAGLAASILEANGIPARVLADTAGGALPSLALAFPVRLYVRREDVELARELLHTSAGPPDDEGVSP